MPDTSTRNQHIEIVAKDLFALRDSALRTQADYGRWLISTLVLLHAGAIVVLLFRSQGVRPELLWPFVTFLVGIIFALLSGFATWLHAATEWEQYDKWGRHALLRPDAPFDEGDRKMHVTTIVAMVFGVMAGVLLPVGAGLAWMIWTRV